MDNKKIALIVLAILLVVGGVYGAMRLVGPMTPEEELMQAERNTSNLDSYSVALEMDIDFEGLEESPDFLFSGNADYDRIEKAVWAEGTLEMSMEGLAANLGASLTYVDDDLYGRVETFPYMALPFGADQVDMITQNDILLMENISEQADLVLAGLAMEMEVEPFTIEDVFEKSEELSERMWREGVISVKDTEEDELDTGPAKKYTLEMDAEKMTDFYLEIVEDYEIMELLGVELTEEERQDLIEEMTDEMKESYEDMEMYAWVQDDYLVRMEVVSATDFSEEDFGEMQEVEGVPESIVVKMVMEYSNFNEEFNIEAPEEYITLEEVMEEFQFLPDFEVDQIDLEQ